MSFSTRVHEIRTGFERPFWIANITEMFERLSYYGAFAFLARYLNETLHFSTEKSTSLTGLFGGLVWFFAAFGGAVADRMGFRRALSLAYFILGIAYFLMGSIATSWMAPIRNTVPLDWLMAFILVLPALGVCLVKPAVVGTTARASKDSVRSIGYSIYYTLVNVGGALGPIVGSYAQRHLGVENVFRVAAVSVGLMFFAVLLFFKEPRSGEGAATLAQTAKNFVTVISDLKFMAFLLIFSGYWIVYWQEFISLPLYVARYIDPNADTGGMLSTGPIVVICFTVLINLAMAKVRSFAAIIIGTVITSIAWIILIFHPTVFMAYATLVVIAIGEIIQAPRYYDYISRLAPPGQQGTYMGFAFMPIGIGSLIAGPLSGKIIQHFGENLHQPEMIWWIITGIGLATAVLLFVYDRIVKPTDQPASAG